MKKKKNKQTERPTITLWLNKKFRATNNVKQQPVALQWKR